MNNIVFVQPVFCPNDTMFNKNIDAIKSWIKYCKAYGYTDWKMFITGYCAEDRYWMSILNLFREELIPNVVFTRLDKNYGKAYAVNITISKNLLEVPEAWDYLLTCDSDIIFDIEEPDIVRRGVKIFTNWVGTKLGCISFAQKQYDCHLHEHLDRTMTISEEDCSWSSKDGGIAGGCLLLSRDAWLCSKGYRIASVYGGDDALLLQDIKTAGFNVIMANSMSIIHPYNTPQEAGYQHWKLVQCHENIRDGFGSTDNFEKHINIADDFWKTQKW
jgi:hypothetical protein